MTPVAGPGNPKVGGLGGGLSSLDLRVGFEEGPPPPSAARAKTDQQPADLRKQGETIPLGTVDKGGQVQREEVHSGGRLENNLVTTSNKVRQ